MATELKQVSLVTITDPDVWHPQFRRISDADHTGLPYRTELE